LFVLSPTVVDATSFLYRVPVAGIKSDSATMSLLDAFVTGWLLKLASKLFDVSLMPDPDCV
jgi:hypothetical protein